jgi:hypothetical protein
MLNFLWSTKCIGKPGYVCYYLAKERGQMSEIVDASKIEKIVGVKRHARAHFARAVSKEESVYVLHSKNCLEDYEDLRECPFSLALDNGIDVDEWHQDRPVLVVVKDNKLIPARIA